MCGLVALVDLAGGYAGADVVDRMSAAIAHRGPDEAGRYLEGPVGFGFRRLSILDLSPLGHQPMTSDDGRFVLVFNGEIYNYVELRHALERLGHRFRSSGDTEVLLRAYCEWGADCVSRLNGMWAFLILDRERRLIFGSRDRFGIKPLYRHAAPERVLFASEIKAIRASGLYEDRPDWDTASRYLLQGRLDDTPHTFYAGIEQVPPGTAFELTLDGRWRSWQYWTIDERAAPIAGDPAQAFAALFEDAVRIHMRSDVPLGVHLSGGLDSTSILCAAARVRKDSGGGALTAFSYLTPEFDESRYVSDTIAHTGATLVKLETSAARLWDLLGAVLHFQDEPVHSMTPLVGYELMRLSSAHGMKVILNGQGADETIGGYGSYFSDYWCTLLAHGRAGEAWREIGRYVAAHPGKRARLYLRQWRRLAQGRLAAWRVYRDLARWKRAREHLLDSWFTRDLPRHARPGSEDIPETDLNRQLARSVYRAPLPLYLRIEDRNSMAHAIEARLPFLDYRLVALLFSLAPEWRIRGPWNKYVLREAMRGRIPESVRTRVDKMGFPTPARSWFAQALSEPALDLMTGRAARERGIYNIDAIVRDMERHRRGEIDLTGRIFDVAQYEAWCAL